VTGPGEPRADGYRPRAADGPRVRTDIVDVYVFRRVPGATDELELLQLLRAGEPLDDTWQPVMGHVEQGERAWETAWREVAEEVGLAAGDPALVGMWALEQTQPYYVAAIDSVVLSPRFAAEVAPGWSPTLNDEHHDARWIRWPFHGGQPAGEFFLWPGQRRAIEELVEVIAPEGSATRERLRLSPPGPGAPPGPSAPPRPGPPPPA
jgi:dATP pyrophosphohydrolase